MTDKMADEAAVSGAPTFPLPGESVLVSPAALVIILPLPPKALSPNARKHWTGRAEEARTYRQHAWAMARVALWPDAQPGAGVRKRPLRTPVLVDVIATYRIKRKRDEDNLTASLKPAFDGLVDAGLIPDDSSEYLRINSVTIRVDPKHRGDGLRLLLWEAPLANTEEEKG